MSYEVGVFVRGTSRDALVNLLRTQFLTVTRLEDTPFGSIAVADVFGTRLVVNDDHGLVDDRGIPFSQYPVQASFSLRAGQIEPVAGRLLCQALARALANAVSATGADCLVVEELQHVLDHRPL